MRREFMRMAAEQLTSRFNFFIQTANTITDLGDERGQLVPNPNLSSLDLEVLETLGMIMGVLLSAEEVFPISLSSIFYDYILGKKIIWKNIKKVFYTAFNNYKSFEMASAKELEFLELKYCTYLSMGEEVEVCPYGKLKKVNQENLTDYLKICKSLQLGTLLQGMERIQRGFKKVTKDGSYIYNTSQTLHTLLQGDPKVINFLIKI